MLAVQQPCWFGSPAGAAQQLEVVVKGWDEAEVLEDVAVGQEGRGYGSPLRVGDGVAEEGDGISDALGVVREHSMQQAVGACPAAIDPAMEFVIVLRRAAKSIGGRDGMVVVMRHQKLLVTHSVLI